MKEEGDDDNAFYNVLPLSEVEEAGSTNPRQRCAVSTIARSLPGVLHPPASSAALPLHSACHLHILARRTAAFYHLRSDFDPLTMPTSPCPCVRALLCYLSHKQPN